jgi:hypothetical protein
VGGAVASPDGGALFPIFLDIGGDAVGRCVVVAIFCEREGFVDWDQVGAFETVVYGPPVCWVCF